MADGVDVKLLGERLRKTRFEREKKEGKKIRLKEVSDATGISIASLSRIERGGSQDVDSSTLIMLCEWMNLPIEIFKQTSTPISRQKSALSTPDVIELHLRADRKLDKKTAEALTTLFRTAYEQISKKG